MYSLLILLPLVLPASDAGQSIELLVWYTVCHPGLSARGQAQLVAVLCSQEVKDILRTRGIRLIIESQKSNAARPTNGRPVNRSVRVE
jgi:hypothetical protein